MGVKNSKNNRKRLYHEFISDRIVHRADILKFYRSNTAQANLSIQRLLKSGKAIWIKTGVYYFKKADEFHIEVPSVNPWIVAGKVHKDSVVTYHSALKLFGAAYSESRIYQIGVPFSVKSSPKPFEFQNIEYRAYRVDTSFGIDRTVVDDLKISHFSKERIILEGLMYPKEFWGMSEFLQSIPGISWINPDKFFEYLPRYPEKTVAMRLGWLLERFQKKWYISDSVLNDLEKFKPISKVFLVAGQRSGNRLFPRWNLMVPEMLLHLEET